MFDMYRFIVLTHDVRTYFIFGGARILSIITAIALILWKKRPSIYVLSGMVAIEVICLGFSAISTTITFADALTIIGLFSALAYYKSTN